MADAMTDTEKLADLIFQSVKVYVDKKFDALFKASTATLVAKMDASDEELAEMRKEFDGRLGELVVVPNTLEEAVEAAVAKAVAALELPKGEPGTKGEPGAPGEPGKDAVIDQAAIDAAVEKAVAAIEVVVPDPIPGEKGADGAPGKDGERGNDGKDGKDAVVDYDGILQSLRVLVDKEFAEHGRIYKWMTDAQGEIQTLVAKEIADIPKPQDGRDGQRGPAGRDAADLVVLASIDPERIYALGTWARHRGGLWKAMRDTDELRDGSATDAGWACVVEGFSGLSLAESSEDGRTITLAAELSSGRKALHTIELGTMIYRGVYEPGKAYKKGDVVTFAGSMVVAKRDTDAMPETPASKDDWQTAVKRGRDGLDTIELKKRGIKREPVRL